MMFDESTLLRLAEQKILEAIKNGEFDNLPGKGQPLNLDDLRNVPPELRMEYKVLKNAGLLPEEMDIRKEITVLEKLLANCQDDDKKAHLRQQLAEKTIMYNIMMEKRRHKTRLR
jgi:hypothetical protein